MVHLGLRPDAAGADSECIGNNNSRDANHRGYMKRYGIRITLNEDHPMRAAHLLGDAWEITRWYDREAQRDRMLADMQRRLSNYRNGDVPSLIYTKVEQDTDD